MSFNYMNGMKNHTLSNQTLKSHTNTGSSVVLIHKMRSARLQHFKIPVGLTDDELQDYILFDKLKPKKLIEIPSIRLRKKYTYGNYRMRGE